MKTKKSAEIVFFTGREGYGGIFFGCKKYSKKLKSKTNRRISKIFLRKNLNNGLYEVSNRKEYIGHMKS